MSSKASSLNSIAVGQILQLHNKNLIGKPVPSPILGTAKPSLTSSLVSPTSPLAPPTSLTSSLAPPTSLTSSPTPPTSLTSSLTSPTLPLAPPTSLTSSLTSPTSLTLPLAPPTSLTSSLTSPTSTRASPSLLTPSLASPTLTRASPSLLAPSLTSPSLLAPSLASPRTSAGLTPTVSSTSAEIQPRISPRQDLAPRLSPSLFIGASSPIQIASADKTIAISPIQNISSSPPTTIITEQSFSSISDLVEKNNVERILTTHGYEPKKKIFIRRDDGTPEVHYILTNHQTGVISLVNVDVENYFISITETDTDFYPVLSEEDGTKTMIATIPYSIKNGIYTTIGNDVSGVGLVCGDGICIMESMVTTEGHSVNEKMFLSQRGSNIPDSSPSISLPRSIPIIKLSEIIANPQQILINLIAVTKRLHQIQLDMAVDKLNKIRDASYTLFVTVDTFAQNILKKEGELRETIANLQENYNNHIKLFLENIVSQENLELFDLTVYNLKYRENMYNDILASCFEITRELPVIDRATANVKNIDDYINQTMSNVKGIYMP